MTTRERFVPIEEAGRRYGVSYRTMRNRVVDGTIQTYRSDRDRRMTLVAIDEIDRIFAPRPDTANSEVEPLSVV